MSKSIVQIKDGKVAQEWVLGPNGISIGSHSVTIQIPDALLRDGLRWKVPADVDRATVKASDWTDTGTEWRETVVPFSQSELDQKASEQEQKDADAAAAQAAAFAESEAIRKATPIVYDQPIEAPLVTILSTTGAKGIGITATDDGDLVTVIVHESPWPDRAALQAKIDTAIAKHRATKAAAKAGINGQMQDRLAALERMMGLRE
jgi:hypothetical protein